MAAQNKKFTRPPPKTCRWLFRTALGAVARAAAWPSPSAAARAWVATWRFRHATSASPSSSGAWAATWPSPSACPKPRWTFPKTAAACSCACMAAPATSSSKSTHWAARACSRTCRAPTGSSGLCGRLIRSTRWRGRQPSVERLCRWKTFTFSPACLTCWRRETRSFLWQPTALWRTWRRCHPVNWNRIPRGVLRFLMELKHRRWLWQEPTTPCSHSSSSFCCCKNTAN